MQRLNYHHLLYFRTVARLGSITRACAELHLTQPTISGQLRALEKSVSAKLFDRVGRRLVLTPTGRMVLDFAEKIFSLGEELQDTLEGRVPGRPLRLVVGVADVLPRLMVCRLLRPVLRMNESVQLVCHDDKTELLLARLALNELDVVLADIPASPLIKIRATNHLLGECGISFLGPTRLVRARRRNFPRSLDGTPLWLPMEGTTLRRSLDDWFLKEQVQPIVLGECGDSDMFDAFAHEGVGLFVVPAAIEKEMCRQAGLSVLGRIETIRERFYAISTVRQNTHPAVAALTRAASRRD